ncbi:unnamed protein product [Pylaiella littoralis]
MEETGGFQAAGASLLAVGLATVCWYAFGALGREKSRSPPGSIRTLRGFEPTEILKDEDDGRVVTFLGRFTWQKEGEVALVKLIAKPMTLDTLEDNLSRLTAKLKSESGAEYAFYDCSMSLWNTFLRGVEGNSYSLEVVAPASERTVNRNRPVTTAMVVETAEMHASVTAPHIDTVVGDGRALSWLFNVLSKQKEADRVLCEDADPEHGFILNIDTKWRTHPDISTVPQEEWHGHPSVTELYCLAICHRRGIRTLRDLRSEHVPMLKEMYRRGVDTIEAVYGVPEDQLRVFVHYLPQFFHFHVHFTRQALVFKYFLSALADSYSPFACSSKTQGSGALRACVCVCVCMCTQAPVVILVSQTMPTSCQLKIHQFFQLYICCSSFLVP